MDWSVFETRYTYTLSSELMEWKYMERYVLIIDIEIFWIVKKYVIMQYPLWF